MKSPSATRIPALILAPAILIASACGGQSTSQGPATTVTATEPVESVESTTTEPPSTTAPTTTASVPSSELIELGQAPSGTELRSLVSSAMDGVRFDVPADVGVINIGDQISLFPDGLPDSNTGQEVAGFGLSSQAADGSIVKTVEHFLNLIRSTPGLEVAQGDRAIELFGFRLEEYRITGEVEGRPGAFSATGRKGASVGSVVGYDSGSVFLAETPSGVLAVSTGTEPETEMILGTALASAELTGPGLDPALPVGRDLFAGSNNQPAPAPLVENGTEQLRVAFTPVPPGTYQLSNVGVPLTLDIGEGWSVQPNVPGFVTLSDDASWGPGDRGLVFLTGVFKSAFVAGGSNEVGDRIEMDPIESFLTNPPEGLEISGVEDVDLGGLVGVRFDIGVTEDRDCTRQKPCDFALISWGPSQLLKSTHQVRVWWFDTEAGPLVVVAQASPPSTFVEEATALMGTARLAQ